MLLVAIEGLIGAGKTTLAKRLERSINESGEARACLVDEPTQDDSVWLKRYYEDQTKWAFHTQCSMLVGRCRMVQWASRCTGAIDIVIFDRSIIGDRMFAYANHKIGNLSDAEYDLYALMFETLSTSTLKMDCIIHVNASVEEAMQSVVARARAGETLVTPTYQDHLREGLLGLLEGLPVIEVARLPLGQVYDLQVQSLRDRLIAQLQAQKQTAPHQQKPSQA